MPLYEYECSECKRSVELLIRSASDQPECPQCGSVKLNRLMSAPSAPAVKGAGDSLPISNAGDCGAPRCCGGMCDL